MSEPIYFYTKSMPYWGLSNFSPPGFEADGAYWPTVEHFFQAQKFASSEMQERIRTALTPKDARTLGQSRVFPIKQDWEARRNEVMLRALRLKFKQKTAFELLLSTGNSELIESSPYDYYWAAGQDGSGQNMLGKLLAIVRDELRLSASVD